MIRTSGLEDWVSCPNFSSRAMRNSFGFRSTQVGWEINSRRKTPPTATSPWTCVYTTWKSSGSWEEGEEGEEREEREEGEGGEEGEEGEEGRRRGDGGEEDTTRKAQKTPPLPMLVSLGVLRWNASDMEPALSNWACENKSIMSRLLSQFSRCSYIPFWWPLVSHSRCLFRIPYMAETF